MFLNGEEVRLSDLTLEYLLMLWPREDLDECFGTSQDHEDAPTRKELNAAITAARATMSDEEWSDEDDFHSRGWTTLSDDEIKAAVRRICSTSRSDQEVQDRLRDELGYPYGDAAIHSTSSGPMRITMVMLHGPRGNTLLVQETIMDWLDRLLEWLWPKPAPQPVPVPVRNPPRRPPR